MTIPQVVENNGQVGTMFLLPVVAFWVARIDATCHHRHNIVNSYLREDVDTIVCCISTRSPSERVLVRIH
jgi:hypothetical protein